MRKLILKQQQIEENKWRYLVMQVVNHTAPKVGSTLSEAEVKRMCQSTEWTVTIKPE